MSEPATHKNQNKDENQDNKVQDQPIRPAATVIVVRDAEPQYEIFMLRRTNQAAFAGGMYVFPGGRVDEHDHSQLYAGHHLEPGEHQSGQRQALGKNWRAYWIAGIRETFEEAGILLAYDRNGRIFEFNTSNQTRFDRYRQQIHDHEITLVDICEKENLTLAIDLIHFYNRWVTPVGRPRRFDTRFFITATPEAQSGLHDGKETIDSCWISPKKALQLHENHEFGMMRVTAMQLREFENYKTAAEFLDMAASNTAFPTNNPSGSAIQD